MRAIALLANPVPTVGAGPDDGGPAIARAPTIAIVGGGIAGLATAWFLRARMPPQQAKVLVLEAQTRPGGTAWTEYAGGYTLETGPNGFLDNKLSTLNLCRALGLAEQLEAAN